MKFFAIHIFTAIFKNAMKTISNRTLVKPFAPQWAELFQELSVVTESSIIIRVVLPVELAVQVSSPTCFAARERSLAVIALVQLVHLPAGQPTR